MPLKKIIIDCMRRVYYSILRSYYYISHLLILSDIRKNGNVNVFFIISSLPMWRLQPLYNVLIGDIRYNLFIILYPFDTYSIEQQRSSIAELRDYFDSRGILYIDASQNEIKAECWKKLHPQIIFYQQMYSTIYHGCLSIDNNLNKLICYLPYGIITIRSDWIYNTKYTNLVWRLFYPTELHIDFAKSHSFNHARNVRVVGEPDASLFKNVTNTKDNSDELVKSIIWAPHYSIASGGLLRRASFLWMADQMLNLAKEYEGRIMFILKPHPRLISALYSHPEWGKAKTDAYFDQWRKGCNTQLATGQYIDLFKSSDAMIHDCGSFTAEYLYTCKPVMFISNNYDHVYSELDYFGAKCLDLHYHGSTIEDVVKFLEKVVLEGEDPLKEDRRLFRKKILMYNGSESVWKTIYDSITSDIFRH